MERSIQEHMGNIIVKREDAANPKRLPEGKNTYDEFSIIGLLKSVRCGGVVLRGWEVGARSWEEEAWIFSHAWEGL